MSSILVHIGYHKTGTKWLRAALFRDPATGYGWVPKDSTPVRALVRDRPLEFDPAATRAQLEPLIAEVEASGLLPGLPGRRSRAATTSRRSPIGCARCCPRRGSWP